MNEINGISCGVTSCKHHNKANKCTAGHITVGCDCASAHNVKDTICETFEECDCEDLNCDCDENGCNDDCDCK